MHFLKNESNEKIQLVFNDFVVRPDKCNFSCSYCLSSEAPEWEITKGVTEKFLYNEESGLGKRLDKVINNFNSIFDAAILRISGGEILLIQGIEDFLNKQDSYETVQIITNGFLLTEDRLKKLKNLPNCQLHISLDGSTYEQNRYRVKNKQMQEVLLNNLQTAVDLGFFIEIGSVLTDANTGNYAEFMDYLRRFEGKVKVYPFPVRGDLRKQFYPNEKDIDKFNDIVCKYDFYREVIPCKAYFEELSNLLTGNRTLRCNIPRTMIQLFDDGKLTPCPNSWTTELGNVLENDKDTVLNNIKNEKMYTLFLQKRPRIDCCRSCFTSLDMLNLYLDNKMTYDEIADIPLYSGKRTKKLLKLFSDMLSEEEGI